MSQATTDTGPSEGDAARAGGEAVERSWRPARSRSGWLDRLKPGDDEIRDLALLETDPSHTARFRPIARGPVFALVGLVAIGIAALPCILLRLLRRRPTSEDR